MLYCLPVDPSCSDKQSESSAGMVDSAATSKNYYGKKLLMNEKTLNGCC